MVKKALAGGTVHPLPADLRKALVERQQIEVERNEAVKALKKERDRLESMNKIMMNREERILELKQQTGALLKELGRPPQYGG